MIGRKIKLVTNYLDDEISRDWTNKKLSEFNTIWCHKKVQLIFKNKLQQAFDIVAETQSCESWSKERRRPKLSRHAVTHWWIIMKNLNFAECTPAIKDVSFKDVVIIGECKCKIIIWILRKPLGKVSLVSHELVRGVRVLHTSGCPLPSGSAGASVNWSYINNPCLNNNSQLSCEFQR